MSFDVDDADDVIPRARRTLSALSGLPLEVSRQISTFACVQHVFIVCKLSTLLRSHSSSRRRHPSVRHSPFLAAICAS